MLDKDLSLIIERKPYQWGLRGDFYLCDEMHNKRVEYLEPVG